MIHVPFRLLKSFHKVQTRLVRELEKKFSGKDVVIVANRRIMPKPTTGAAIARPRSRTLTAVHAALLEDLVYPTEIVGKRTRYLTDGSKLLKVYLDPKDRCAPRSEAAGLGLRLRPVRVALTVVGAQEHDIVQAGQLLPRLQEAHRPCVLLRVPGHHRELEPACGQRHAAAGERPASLQTHNNRKNVSRLAPCSCITPHSRWRRGTCWGRSAGRRGHRRGTAPPALPQPSGAPSLSQEPGQPAWPHPPRRCRRSAPRPGGSASSGSADEEGCA